MPRLPRLTLTGTPKEIDEHLPRQLVEFLETHLGLSSTLKRAKEEMGSTAKAAREAAKKPTTRNLIADPAKSGPPSPSTMQTETGTKENSDDSQSCPAPTNVVVGAAGGSLSGSTRSLFDVEPKNDN